MDVTRHIELGNIVARKLKAFYSRKGVKIPHEWVRRAVESAVRNHIGDEKRVFSVALVLLPKDGLLDLVPRDFGSYEVVNKWANAPANLRWSIKVPSYIVA